MAHVLKEHLLSEGLAPRTVYHYLRVCAAAEAWFEAHGYELSKATATQVAEFLLTVPATWSSRNLVRAGLGHYWRAFGHPRPPSAAVRVPTRPPMVCRAVEPEDGHLLAKSARSRGDPKGLAVCMGLYLGLRRSEIAGLRWTCFEDGWVTVTGKGERTRTIPVHAVVRQLLAAHPRQGPWLFPGRFNGPVHPATIWQWTLEVAEEAGLGHVSTHILRHTALATANDNTGDLRSVQDFAGHTNPAVTSGYTRTTARRLMAVVAALDY